LIHDLPPPAGRPRMAHLDPAQGNRRARVGKRPVEHRRRGFSAPTAYLLTIAMPGF